MIVLIGEQQQPNSGRSYTSKKVDSRAQSEMSAGQKAVTTNPMVYNTTGREKEDKDVGLRRD